MYKSVLCSVMMSRFQHVCSPVLKIVLVYIANITPVGEINLVAKSNLRVEGKLH